jgi:hypothetical protein
MKDGDKVMSELMLYNYVLSQLDVDKKYLLPLDKKGCVIPYENITSGRKRYYKHIPDPTFIDDDDVEENTVSNLKCHSLKRRYVDNTLIDSINAFVNHYNNKSDITSFTDTVLQQLLIYTKKVVAYLKMICVNI